MLKHTLVGLIAGMLLAGGASAAPEEWKLTHADTFDRATLGTDWLILRGDWHINKQGQLQIQRQWPSHSWIMSTVPLRGSNVKAEFDLVVPSRLLGFKSDEKAKAPLDRSSVEVYLQGGALGWGGGGIDDRIGIKLVGVPAAQAAEQQAQGKLALPLDKVAHVTMTLADGHYTVQLDGKTIESGSIPQGRSLINSGLQFAASPCAVFDNLKIYTRPMAPPLPAINSATPEENRKATVLADKFIDPKKPDCGIQDAIDALPPGGGVVILPKGTFLLRRFLELRSHTTLMGQGPQTVLHAMNITGARVEKAVSENGTHRLTLAGANDFRPGDAFSYGPVWGHPMYSKDKSQNRLLVLAVDGNVLTVNAPPPAELQGKSFSINHFFPPVCSYESEYAEVKDLAIYGPKTNAAGCKGGFQVNPVTFGVSCNPRFTRLVIKDFPADGISAQVCNDGRFFDNTISGVFQGMHPGTTTLRTMVARNYSVDNGTGLFFCWYNANGIYYRNFVKTFTGYPDAGDVFNTLAFNRLTSGMTITVGYNGCLFGNVMEALQVSVPNESNGPGNRTYGLPARYFTIGLNRLGKIDLIQGAFGNVLAANTTPDGAPTPVAHLLAAGKPAGGKPEKTIMANDAKLAPLAGLPALPDRSEPVLPPELPLPVIEGRDVYKPEAPDCGFQTALDQLAPEGGTLRLPGGRYALAQPLRVPSNVTLTGYGSGTILLPRGGAGSLIVVTAASNAVIRDLAIEGTWQADAGRDAAIAAEGAVRLAVIAVDIRGWPGGALKAAGGRDLRVADCRVLRCAGTGYDFTGVTGLVCETSSAVSCQEGFAARGGAGIAFFGNIAGLNQGAGYRIASAGAIVAGGNAHNNLNDGILVEQADNVLVAGNTADGNNQCGGPNAGSGPNAGNGPNAGIRLAAGVTGARVLFNNCGDEQLNPTQVTGIREEPGAERNEIRFNNTAPLCAGRVPGKGAALVAQGKKSVVADNWTETIVPVNDSIETIEWLKAQPWQNK